MKESRLTMIARRGLVLPGRDSGADPQDRHPLPAATGRRLPAASESMEASWRGIGRRGRTPGALRRLRRCGRWSQLPWLQRVQNFLPNGMHAVIVGDEFVRVEMFRFENTYDLLITTHWLERSETAKRRNCEARFCFSAATAFLKPSYGARTRPFGGGAMPHFLTRSGEPGPPEPLWTDATLKVTEAVCCCGCRHSHLLEAAPALRSETGRGARMIDWHHPRIYERLRCFGLVCSLLGWRRTTKAIPPSQLRRSSWQRSWSSGSDRTRNWQGRRGAKSRTQIAPH